MATSISEFAQSLRQLGEVQVNDWDIMALLNKDFDLGDSLRKLGNTQVTKLDFGSVMPTLHKLAHQEVELPDVVKRTAQFKVLDWDFRRNSSSNTPLQSGKSAKVGRNSLDPAEMQALTDRLRSFLQFMVVNLINEPDRAEIRVQEIEPGVIRFRVLVSQKDVKDLIGRSGATASSIRNLLKATATSAGVHALLDILSHEEEMAQSSQ